MNLIEQLGGYEKAKKLVDGCKRYGRSDVKVPVNGGFIHIVADFLELALLEYRRQHNKIEVGDSIFLAETEDELIVVCEQHKEMYYNLGFIHATDEEIKAGRRL